MEWVDDDHLALTESGILEYEMFIAEAEDPYPR
jgi:hypothetical protein